MEQQPKGKLAVVLEIQRFVERWAARLGALLIILMMFGTSIDVIMRYGWGSPLYGNIETQSTLLVGVMFLGLAEVQARHGHVIVDITERFLPKNARLVMDTSAMGVALVIMSIVTWISAVEGWESLVTGEYIMGAVNLPIWPARLFLTMGAGLYSLRLLRDLITSIKVKPAGVGN